MTKTELDCEHLKTLTESKTLHDNLIAKRNVEKVTNRVMDYKEVGKIEIAVASSKTCIT